MKFVSELSKLFVEVIADDQRMAATEKLANCQTSISCKQPALVLYRSLDQCFVRDRLFVGGVIAENP